MSYLYGDQLGSVSFATSANGSSTSRQDYDAWGAVRSGGISQTTLNYTGQRLDSTGLLDYHARLYDPTLARFVSADSVIPGDASGGMDGVQLRPLTADFHEPGFVATLNGENVLGFWFQLSDDDRQQAGVPWGPANPQALNRYSYVLNAPVKATDPSGHTVILPSKYVTIGQIGNFNTALRNAKYDLMDQGKLAGVITTILSGALGGLVAGEIASAVSTAIGAGLSWLSGDSTKSTVQAYDELSDQMEAAQAAGANSFRFSFSIEGRSGLTVTMRAYDSMGNVVGSAYAITDSSVSAAVYQAANSTGSALPPAIIRPQPPQPGYVVPQGRPRFAS